MDSLIHYEAADVVRVLSGFAARTRVSLAFTFAPRTRPLAVMHAVGRLLPRGNRAPAIVPVSPDRLVSLIGAEPTLHEWKPGRTERIGVGFYTSQVLELSRR
jgi:magnesium-protoporphyrin O-methyltransferase